MDMYPFHWFDQDQDLDFFYGEGDLEWLREGNRLVILVSTWFYI